MDGAVLVRVAKPGRAAPLNALQPSADELGFDAATHRSWTDPQHRIGVDLWSPTTAAPTGLHGDFSNRQATFGIGASHGSHGSHGCLPPATPHACATTRGTFVAGQFDHEGRGWISADPFGLRCLYVGESDEFLVLGSRAGLVAAGIGDGSRSTRATSVLAHLSHWVGRRTGFAGVELAPERHYLEVGGEDHRFARWISHPALPASELPALSGASTIVDELIVGLRAALERDASNHVIQLTGGRDSRMLLACALAGGIADRFEYQTAGTDDHPDVAIAQGLCRRYGLRHQTLFAGMRTHEPFADQARRWVERTGGMVSAWEAPGRAMTDVRVTGVGGEVVRSFRTVAPRRGDPQAGALAVLDRVRPGRLGLVRPEAREQLRFELEGAMAEGDGDVLRRVHLFYARNRMRFTRFGPRLEIETEQRIAPFVSPVIQSAALATDGTERQAGLLCLEVLRATAPDLLAVPFAAHPWNDLARSHLPPPPPPPIPHNEPLATPSAPAGAPDAQKPSSLMGGLFAPASDERMALVRSALADQTNPIWQVLDREAGAKAASRWDDLHLVERRELMGAVSAALWAGS